MGTHQQPLLSIGQGLILLLAVIGLACGGKKTTEPTGNIIKRVWVAQMVKENNVVVYTKGAGGNIRNYASFQLDLSQPSNVSFTDVDGVVLKGQYDLPDNTRLILRNLQPQPTGTNGTIEFGITALSASQLELTRTGGNPKTGNTLNHYMLTTL